MGNEVALGRAPVPVAEGRRMAGEQGGCKAVKGWLCKGVFARVAAMALVPQWRGADVVEVIGMERRAAMTMRALPGGAGHS